MLRLGMLVGCIFAMSRAMKQQEQSAAEQELTNGDDAAYSVTCYMCVNVSDNLVCNQYAIDRPCTAGQTFCHTLHIMDSKGDSVLVNKKCATEIECQASKVGCVHIDTQLICVSCCDQNYCNINAPTNSSNATFDDKNTKMRNLAKSLFKERDKALKTIISDSQRMTFSFYTTLMSLIFLILL